jgi:anti-sigma factor RsiW
VTGQHPLDKLSAAIDGELDHDTRDRVFSHLVGCEFCRAEADEQRRLKAQLGLLGTPEPAESLMQRLLAVPEFSTEPREEVRPVPQVTLRPAHSAFPAGPQRPAARPAASARPAVRQRSRAVVMTAAGSAAAVVTLLGTAFAVGDPAEQPPLLQPPVSSFSADHASTTGGYPFGDPAAMLGSFNGAAYTGTGTDLFQPVAFTGR